MTSTIDSRAAPLELSEMRLSALAMTFGNHQMLLVARM